MSRKDGSEVGGDGSSRFLAEIHGWKHHIVPTRWAITPFISGWNNPIETRLFSAIYRPPHVKLQIFDEVMHAMNAWKDEARVQHFACLALSNFAHDDSNKVAIGILIRKKQSDKYEIRMDG